MRSGSLPPQHLDRSMAVIQQQKHITASSAGRGVSRAPSIVPMSAKRAPSAAPLTTRRAPSVVPSAVRRAPSVVPYATRRASSVMPSMVFRASGATTVRRAPSVEPTSIGRVPILQSRTTPYRRASISLPVSTLSYHHPVSSVPFRAYSPNRAVSQIRSYSPTRGLTTTSATDGNTYGSKFRVLTRNAGSGNRSVNHYATPTSSLISRAVTPTLSRRRVVCHGIAPSAEYIENGTPQRKMEMELDSFLNQKQSLTDLKSRTAAARNQLSRHRVMLDKYLPIGSGPLADVEDEVEYKYGELLTRMPQLDYANRHKANDSDEATPLLIIPPYRPAAVPPKGEPLPYLPPVKSNFAPKMSDVRKRARTVLCKIKGDPNYFDFS